MWNNDGKIKALRWTSKAPSSCGRDTLFSAMEAAMPAWKVQQKRVPPYPWGLVGRKTVEGRKIPQSDEASKKWCERIHTLHQNTVRTASSYLKPSKNVQFETFQIKAKFYRKVRDIKKYTFLQALGAETDTNSNLELWLLLLYVWGRGQGCLYLTISIWKEK